MVMLLSSSVVFAADYSSLYDLVNVQNPSLINKLKTGGASEAQIRSFLVDLGNEVSSKAVNAQNFDATMSAGIKQVLILDTPVANRNVPVLVSLWDQFGDVMNTKVLTSELLTISQVIKNAVLPTGGQTPSNPSGSGGGQTGGASSGASPVMAGAVAVASIPSQVGSVISKFEPTNIKKTSTGTFDILEVTKEALDQLFKGQKQGMANGTAKKMMLELSQFEYGNRVIMPEFSSYLSGNNSVQLKLKDISIEVPTGALSVNQVRGGLVFHIDKEEDVYAIGISKGITDITSFGKPLKIALPYTLKVGENSQLLNVVYLDEKNIAHKQGGYYSNGQVIFYTNHLSRFKVENQVSEVKFTDMANQPSFANAKLQALYAKGLIQGKSANLFDPNAPIKRGEVAIMLTKLFQYQSDASKQSPVAFSDVKQSDWFYEGIAAAYQNNLMSGISKNEFRPNQNITNQEILVVLGKILTEKGLQDNLFVLEKDLSYMKEVDNWAFKSVSTSVASGLLKDLESGIRLKAPSTRIQTVSIIFEALKLLYQ
jgi:hypothetical protein